MKLHPASLAVGAVLMVGVGILSAQNLVNSPTLEVRLVEPVGAYLPANPKSFVRLEEGQQFLVPSERILVITALGLTPGAPGVDVELHLNGVEILQGQTLSTQGQMCELPLPGITAAPGDSVEVKDTSAGSYGFAIGYLADD